MVKALLEAGKEQVHSDRVKGIVISTPGIKGFDCEDFDDALEYLGVHGYRLNLSYYDGWPSALESSYAGHGLDICANSSYHATYRGEDYWAQWRAVLLVDASKTALMVQYDNMLRTVGGHSSESRNDFEFNGSSGDRPDLDGRVWNLIAPFLREKGAGQRPEVDYVIITGESAADYHGLLQWIRLALWDAGAGNDWQVLDTDPLYTTAKGAAELAWREAMKSDMADEKGVIVDL